jgi:hypothetical protein
MDQYLKPLPTLNDDNRPFWDACRDGNATPAATSAFPSTTSAPAA